MDALTRFGLCAEDYSLSTEITTHEKDGQQQLQIGFLAIARLSLLSDQLESINLNFNSSFLAIPLGLGAAVTVAATFAKEYLAKNPKESGALSLLCRFTVQAGKVGAEICQKANPVMNAACSVSYVAMIYFGHPVAGAMGLASLVVISVKRYGCLPNWLDRAMEPVVFAASAWGVWNIPGGGFVRVALLVAKLSEGIDLLKRFESAHSFIPESLRNPVPGKHEKKHGTQPVNITHIYSEKVSQIFPGDFKAEVDKLDVTDLFNQAQEKFINLYKRNKDCSILTLDGLIEMESNTAGNETKERLIQEFLISGDDNERAEFYYLIGRDKTAKIKKVFTDKPAELLKELARSLDEEDLKHLRTAAAIIAGDRLKNMAKGYAILRSGVEHGIVEDSLPPNFELFKRMMKALLKSTLDEEGASFMTGFKMLCEMGLSCSEGWPSQASHMLSVNTDDLEWALHHHLAKLRGSLVNWKLAKLSETTKLEMVGGTLDVHVVDAVHCAVYPLFRTFEAEFYHQVNPREMDEALWILAMNKSKNREWGVLDTAFLMHEIAHVHFALMFYTYRFIDLLKGLDKEYTSDLIVKEIYTAIKPSGQNGARKIGWKAIQKAGYDKPDNLETVMVGGKMQRCLKVTAVKQMLEDHFILN